MIIHKFQSIKPQQIKNKEPLYCTACAQQTPIESCGNGPDNGLHLHGFAGYYGGFTDRCEVGFDDTVYDEEQLDIIRSSNEAWFCHDCCVKLFAVFPNLALAVGIRNKDQRQNMHHSSTSDIPCCNYCWKVEKSSYIEDDFIEYIPQYNVTTKKLQWKQL